LLGALLRRPPGTAVLIALAVRPRQTPEYLSAPLERAHREGVLTRIELGALTPAEARAFLGELVDPAEAAALYEESGGNPFYLQQLARALELTHGAASAAAEVSLAIGVPSAVAAALTEELALLSEPARLALEGAAVAGDPFEPELAAAAAEMSEDATMGAVDALLHLDLIRQTDLPRRFRFRHPLVRRAVYETTRGGWRLQAHKRCAEALAARGAAAAARAHHVERSAREGDLAAVAVLREAGEAAARLAPESAARWFSAALRLLPHAAPAQDRIELLLARAWALAAVGRFTHSHQAVLEAAALVPGQPSALSTTVATACASVERFLGRYEHAHTRLVRALRVLPEPASVERVELLIELTLNEFYRSRYEAMRNWAAPAVTRVVPSGSLTRPGRGIPCTACTLSCPGSGTCAASWPRLPSSWTVPSRPGVCSGRRRRLPAISSTGPSSQSRSAIWTSRSPPQRRASSSRATSTKVSSRLGLRRGSPTSCWRPGNRTGRSTCSSAAPVVRS
jgi:hypothetical protein